jgi:hypothetical protein
MCRSVRLSLACATMVVLTESSGALRRRVRFLPPDGGHWNHGKTGWAYPPGTYEPGVEEGGYWIFEPDDDDLPNFADPSAFVSERDARQP